MFTETRYYAEFKKLRNRFRKYRYHDLIGEAIALNLAFGMAVTVARALSIEMVGLTYPGGRFNAAQINIPWP